MKKLIMLLIGLGLLVQPAIADEKTEILKTVKKQVGVVLDTLDRTDLDKETKNKKIIDALEPFFDFDRMAKLSLGKKGWKAMNKKQRAEFSDLFVRRLKESYLEKFNLYTDETVEVEKAKLIKKRIHVYSYLVSKDDKIDMVYKFYKSKKGWKVYDVVILGVSIVQTYRTQFAAALKEGSVEGLLTKLRVSGGFKAPTGSD